MAKTDAVNTGVPAGSESPRQGDDRMRALARAIIELAAVDHAVGTPTGTAYDSDDAGKHDRVTLVTVESTKPTLTANDKGMLYLKGTPPELFYEDSAGNEKQLTTAGKLNVAATEAVLLTGNQTVAGIKTLTSQAVFQAGISLAGESANQLISNVLNPVSAQDAATKNYVDTARKYVNATQSNRTTTIATNTEVIDVATAFGAAKTCLIIASFTFGNAAGDNDGGYCTAKIKQGSTVLWEGLVGWSKYNQYTRCNLTVVGTVANGATVSVTLTDAGGDTSKLYNDDSPANLTVMTIP